jgi:hypothetical protein
MMIIDSKCACFKLEWVLRARPSCWIEFNIYLHETSICLCGVVRICQY